MGRPQPWTKPPTSGEAVSNAKLVDAVTGDRKASMPTWDGSPAGLRSWLKQLSFWEAETGAPREKWGMKLLQSLTGEARRSADVVDAHTLMSPHGYGAILTNLMAKYQAYLDAVGPLSIDAFLFTGERQARESFTSFLNRKETQKMEMENQIGATLHPMVSGRVVLRQASLSDQQQQMLMLKSNALLSYEDVVKILQPLDRLDTLAKTGALSNATNKIYLQAGEDADDGDEDYSDDEGEDYDEESNTEDESGLLEFENKEYDEIEAVYVQAYNDVRRDLRSRRKERGFVRHGRKASSSTSPKKGRGKGRGKRDGRKQSNKQHKDEFIRGTEAELLARTKCFSCQELGHISRNCPHNKPAASSGPPKKTFVAVTPSGQSATTSFVVFKHVMSDFPPKQEELLRAVYAGVQVNGFEAVVDTAAEQCIIGSSAFDALKDELASVGLRPVPVRQAATPCAGIGGRAKLMGVHDVPTCVAGLLGILRFTVIADTVNFVTPPLLGISCLETIKANIDLDTNLYTTPDGHTTLMRRLPTGHRAINMLDFGMTKWKLPQQHQVRGRDPFRLPDRRSPHNFLGGDGAVGGAVRAAVGFLSSPVLPPPGLLVSREEDAGAPMTAEEFDEYVQSSVEPLEDPHQDRSRSPHRREASVPTAVAYTEEDSITSRLPNNLVMIKDKSAILPKTNVLEKEIAVLEFDPKMTMRVGLEEPYFLKNVKMK